MNIYKIIPWFKWQFNIISIRYNLYNLWLFLTWRKRCWQCGGTGEYYTEMMARYDNHGVICPNCNGKGWKWKEE